MLLIASPQHDRVISRFFDLDIGLIHLPGVIGSFEVRAAALLQFWGVVLNPPINGAINNMQSSFPHHLFQATITEESATLKMMGHIFLDMRSQRRKVHHLQCGRLLRAYLRYQRAHS